MNKGCLLLVLSERRNLQMEERNYYKQATLWIKIGEDFMGLQTTFDVRENVLIVRFNGELDHHEAENIRKKWQIEMYQQPIKHVVINLEALEFMDSSGLGVILGRYKEVLELGGEMVVCSPSPTIKRLFEMSGIFKIVRLEENEQFALSTLGVAS